jgi:polysaccharide biosynthesis protein PslF
VNTVVFVSTYPPFKCGIAVYTKNLVRAIAEQPGWTCSVVSEGGADGAVSFPVFDTYSRQGDYAAAILDKLDALKPQIVHFQHASDLFPDNARFAALLEAIAARGMRVFVTLHTIYDRPRQHRFHQRIARSAGIIVHSESGRDILARNLHPGAKVTVIPHGTVRIPLPDQREARRALGLPEDRFIFLFFGAIHIQKNLHTVVQAFRRVVRSSDCAVLVAAGRPGGDRFYNRAYVKACRLMGGRSERYIWRHGFIADEDVTNYLAAADVLLLPYWQSYYSASGVLHMAMGTGKPVICSSSPKFDEVSAGSDLPVFVPALAIGRWADAMRRIMTDEPLRASVSRLLRDRGDRTAWDAVAARHADLFLAE